MDDIPEQQQQQQQHHPFVGLVLKFSHHGNCHSAHSAKSLDNFQQPDMEVSDLIINGRSRRFRYTKLYRILVLSPIFPSLRFTDSELDADLVDRRNFGPFLQSHYQMTGNPQKTVNGPIVYAFLCVGNERCTPLVHLGMNATDDNIKAYKSNRSAVVLDFGLYPGQQCPISLELLKSRDVIFTQAMLKAEGSVQFLIKHRIQAGDTINEQNKCAVPFVVLAILRHIETGKVFVAKTRPFHFVDWKSKDLAPLLPQLPDDEVDVGSDWEMDETLPTLSQDEVIEAMNGSGNQTKSVGAAIPHQIPHGDNYDQSVTSTNFLAFQDGMEANNPYPKESQHSLDTTLNQGTKAMDTGDDTANYSFLAFGDASSSTLSVPPFSSSE